MKQRWMFALAALALLSGCTTVDGVGQDICETDPLACDTAEAGT